ncbi:hypothetical protein AC062_1643 [Pasteurellaceae bacterium NI1060]|nr:hypothetical protein AC062_1643 [Pasteurellaceae bacterium NI1060]
MPNRGGFAGKVEPDIKRKSAVNFNRTFVFLELNIPIAQRARD